MCVKITGKRNHILIERQKHWYFTSNSVYLVTKVVLGMDVLEIHLGQTQIEKFPLEETDRPIYMKGLRW